MKLIDANALKEHKYHSTQTFENAVAVAHIDNAPTVPAITLDWLDDQIHGYAARLQSTELKALLIVKGLWEKEQEAKRNG